MNFKLVKLNFTSPLHIGRGKPDFYDSSDNILHSDTIKSALFSTVLLFDNSKGREFFDSFSVSSSYPFLGDKVFFPVPDLPLDRLVNKFNFIYNCVKESDEALKYDKGKLAKKIRFLEKSLYEKFINGQVIDVKINELNDEEKQLISGYLLAEETKKEDFKLSKNEVNQRVYIYRMSEILASDEENPKFSDPYYVDKIYFHDNAGLYFLIKADNQDTLELLKKAIELLQDFGFGTDRNIGNGQFELDEDAFKVDFNIETPADFNLLTNLSLYLPDGGEIERIKQEPEVDERFYYSIVERGGYISNFLDQEYITLLKNPVKMFAERSIFPKLDLKGKSVSVEPEDVNHPIWRDGQAIFIPFKL